MLIAFNGSLSGSLWILFSFFYSFTLFKFKYLQYLVHFYLFFYFSFIFFPLFSPIYYRLIILTITIFLPVLRWTVGQIDRLYNIFLLSSLIISSKPLILSHENSFIFMLIFLYYIIIISGIIISHPYNYPNHNNFLRH